MFGKKKEVKDPLEFKIEKAPGSANYRLTHTSGHSEPVSTIEILLWEILKAVSH